MTLQNRFHHQEVTYLTIQWQIREISSPLCILLQFFIKKQSKFLSHFCHSALVKYFINQDGPRFAIFSFKKFFFVQYRMWHYKYATLIVLSYTLNLQDYFHKKSRIVGNNSSKMMWCSKTIIIFRTKLRAWALNP